METSPVDDVFEVLGRVALRGREGSGLGQERVGVAGEREGLVVGEVPVEHVEFGHRHCADRLLERRHRQEVPRRVEQHLAVREARCVGYMPRRAPYQVMFGVEAPQRSDLRFRCDARKQAVRGAVFLAGGDRDRQLVGLVCLQVQCEGNVLDRDLQRGQEASAGAELRCSGLSENAVFVAQEGFVQHLGVSGRRAYEAKREIRQDRKNSGPVPPLLRFRKDRRMWL
eukprot:2447893-Rhodomonas_salina.1